MNFEKMTPREIADHYTKQLISNLISMWGTKDKAIKKINDKTHFEILRICRHIEETFPQSMAIVDELGKNRVPESEFEYVMNSIAYGVNTKDAFSRLRNLVFECHKKYKLLSILTDEGKRNASLKDLVGGLVSRTFKYQCYNIANINQKNIAVYDKKFLQKELGSLSRKNGGPLHLDEQSETPIRGPMFYNGKQCSRYLHTNSTDEICKKCKYRSCEK